MIIRRRDRRISPFPFCLSFSPPVRGLYSMKAVPTTTQSADKKHVSENSTIILYGVFEGIYEGIVRLFVSFNYTRTKMHTRRNVPEVINFSFPLTCLSLLFVSHICENVAWYTVQFITLELFIKICIYYRRENFVLISLTS